MRDEQLIADLRLALDRASARNDPHGEAWPQIERRLGREPWRRAALGGLAAAVVAATVVATPLIWHMLARPGAERSQSSAIPAGRLAVVSRVHMPGESQMLRPVTAQSGSLASASPTGWTPPPAMSSP